MPKKIGNIDGLGPFMGMSIDELDEALVWTQEEEAIIGRLCDKILANIEEDEMTPWERWKATVEGKERDRLLVDTTYHAVYAVRALDSFANALRPLDAYLFPKINILANLALVARFNLDVMVFSNMLYAENMFGWDCRALEYGRPFPTGKPPIKSMEDLEGLEIGDAYVDSIYPQYLWSGRELRRIFKKHGLHNVLPLNVSACAEPLMTAALGMMGQAQFMMATIKNPELAEACATLASGWCIDYATKLIKTAEPDILFMCGFYGCSPYKGNEWMAELNAKVGKAVGPQCTCTWGWALNGILDQWMQAQLELGAIGPGGYVGIEASGDVTFEPMIDFLADNNLYGLASVPDKMVLEGPVSKIEEEVKRRCEYMTAKGKDSKIVAGYGAIDYWTTPDHFEAGIKAFHEYGRF